MKEGQGTYTYKDDSRYEGEWCQDHKHGNGTMFYKNGDKYVGQWVNGKR